MKAIKTIRTSENTFRKKESHLFKLLLLTILLVVFSANTIKAENPATKKGSIAGKITDKGSAVVLQYATVALYNASDSSLLNGTITNEEGVFSIENIPSGNYWLEMQLNGNKKVVERILIQH